MTTCSAGPIVDVGVARQRLTFFCFAKKKVSKEKATRSLGPALRYGFLAVLKSSGVTCKLACGSNKHVP